jgi:hypothetical protein
MRLDEAPKASTSLRPIIGLLGAAADRDVAQK